MAELVVPVSKDLKRQMESSRLVNWERTARRAVAERAAELALFKGIVSRSQATEQDAIRIGKKINGGMCRRLLDERR